MGVMWRISPDTEGAAWVRRAAAPGEAALRADAALQAARHQRYLAAGARNVSLHVHTSHAVQLGARGAVAAWWPRLAPARAAAGLAPVAGAATLGLRARNPSASHALLLQAVLGAPLADLWVPLARARARWDAADVCVLQRGLGAGGRVRGLRVGARRLLAGGVARHARRGAGVARGQLVAPRAAAAAAGARRRAGAHAELHAAHGRAPRRLPLPQVHSTTLDHPPACRSFSSPFRLVPRPRARRGAITICNVKHSSSTIPINGKKKRGQREQF